MSSLRFSGPDAVRAVLGLLPPEVAAAGGAVLQEPDGALVVTAELPAALRKTLRDAGVEELKAQPRGARRPFLHWAELVPLVPESDPDLRIVLFALPPGAPWLPLAAELVRLGCDAQEIASDGERWLIRATRPPYYTIIGTGNWRVYTRQGPAWVRFGWRHLLADRIHTGSEDTLLRIDEEGWHRASIPTWTEITDRIDLDMAQADKVQVLAPRERLKVRLRLVPSPRTAPPSAWIVAPPVDTSLAALLAQLPEALVSRLQIAHYQTAEGQQGALLRTRPGAEGVVIEGMPGYTVHPQLPSIWVPAGRTIDPPLRPNTLLTLLDPPAGYVTWLEESADGGFRSRRIPEDSFRPLHERVLYDADRDRDAVDAWIGTTVFDWEPLDLPVVRESEEAPRAGRQSRQGRAENARTVQPAPAPEPRRGAVQAAPRQQPAQARIDVAWVPPSASAQERELQRLQDEYRADPNREDLWIPMAVLHHALSAPRDAAACWARVLWDAEPEAVRNLAGQWAERVPRIEALPAEPDINACCAVVAHLLAGNAPVASMSPPDLQRWLDANDAVLDVRLRWLARRAVAQLAGGDLLALARARDAVLASIRGGLSTSRDVPSFLRTSNTPEERRILVASLGVMADRLNPYVPRSAPVDCTRSYLRLTIAWAQARLGLDEPVHQAIAYAERTLPKDPVHSVLLSLYRSGIQEALDGLPAETPPPLAVREALAALERFDRYKVDRLREQSLEVLSETGTRSAFASFVRDEVDTLPAIPTDALRATIDRWLVELGASASEQGLMRVLNAAVALADSEAAPVLAAVIRRTATLPPAERVPVLVESLSVAAALRRTDSAQQALEPLGQGLIELARQDANAIIEPALTAARALARCGLDVPARAVLLSLHDSVPKDNWLLRIRLRAALAQVGGEVADAITTAFDLLGRGLTAPQRLAVVSSTADLAAPLPAAEAVGVWERLAPHAHIEDAYSTSSHFALSFLTVAERLIAAHVHPNRLLGPEGRRLIDADEHRVRQRIHASSESVG